MIEQDTTLADYHRMFFDADEAANDERKEGNQSRDYFDCKQYTAEETEILAKRRQPPTTLNRVARKINHLLGLEVDRRTDPKAYPRTTNHEQEAQAATDSLRYVEQNIQLDQIFSSVHETMLIEGFGGFELTVEPAIERRQETFKIGATFWEWSRLFYDPHSVKHDYSDATYVGGVEWLDLAVAKAKFPDKEDILEITKSMSGGTSLTDDYDDTPEKKAWITKGARPRVRVVHMYKKTGDVWSVCQFTGGGILSNKLVPFKDEEGENWCPLILQSAYVDRDGDRYGEVRNLISPQDMINKTHSKLQHLISVRQIIAEEGAISEAHGGVDAARQELAKPDGVIITTPGMKFDIAGTADQVAGHASLLQEFKGEIDLMGPNASMQGKGPQSQSGRALIAQTEGGMREFNPVADRYGTMKERAYRLIWLLIKQYWSAEKMVRVTDDERNVKHIALNRPVTRMEKAMKMLEQKGGTQEQMDMVRQQIESHPVYAGIANDQVEIENEVAQIDVDIIIESGPDMVTLQSEQFAELAKLAPSMAAAGKPIPPEILIEASNLRNKEKLIKMLSGEENPQQMQERQRKEQLQEQIAIKQAQTSIDLDQSNIDKNQAGAEKLQVEAARILHEPMPDNQAA